MSIQINNLSATGTPLWDTEHPYELCSGKKRLVEFKCVRTPDGLSALLRAAADAWDEENKRRASAFAEKYGNLLNNQPTNHERTN